VILLPDEIDGLPALEARLNPEGLGRWLSGLRKQKVQVLVPRFKLTCEFSLADVLRSMGMPLAFDEQRANLSGISSQERLSLSGVIHKSFVDVNEEGTEAAAATGVVAKTVALELDEPAMFRADHPFLFVIRDNRTGSILFMRRVANPAARRWIGRTRAASRGLCGPGRMTWRSLLMPTPRCRATHGRIRLTRDFGISRGVGSRTPATPCRGSSSFPGP